MSFCGRAIDLLQRVLGDTKPVIIGAGSLATSIAAVIALVAALSTHKAGPTPPGVEEAKIVATEVESGVFLAQYEEDSRPAGSGKASYQVQPQGPHYRLIAYRAPQSAGGAVGVAANSGSSPASAVTGTTSTAPPAAGGEGPTAAGQPKTSELPAAEAREVKEATKTSETAVAKAKDEANAQEEVKSGKEEAAVRVRGTAAKEQAAAKVIKEEAAIEARQQTKTRATEAAKIAEEERAERKREQTKRSAPTTGRRARSGVGARQYQAFAKPPPSATPFHREGDAKVLIGTGASTSEVDTVLGKVAAILDRAKASPGRQNAAFGGRDAIFSDTSTGAPIDLRVSGAAATAAGGVPFHCGPTCGLRPTIDQAIADYSTDLAEAARVVAAAFAGSRVGILESRPQPVGVTVDYSVRFLGFAGKRLVLEWTLCSKAAGRPLPRSWWRNVIFKQIVPASDDTRTGGHFWAPVPPAQGDYYFRLRVFEGDSEPTQRGTEAFH
jgi:hypothetical protein